MLTAKRHDIKLRVFRVKPNQLTSKPKTGPTLLDQPFWGYGVHVLLYQPGSTHINNLITIPVLIIPNELSRGVGVPIQVLKLSRISKTRNSFAGVSLPENSSAVSAGGGDDSGVVGAPGGGEDTVGVNVWG